MEQMTQPRKGQALSEYGLAIGLVALVGFAGLSLLGKDLSGALNVMLPKWTPPPPPVVSVTKPANTPSVTGANGSPVTTPSAPSSLTTGGKSCFSNGQCITASIQPYAPEQTAGSNGINIVDQYADIINKIGNMAHSDSKINPDFADMITDLADDGHGVAGDERSVLTYTQSSDGSFDFSIQDRYAQTLNRAMNYLNSHPNELSPETANLLRTAANNITKQMVDFIGGSNPGSLSSLNINSKFTDKGGGNGASYVDSQASTVCANGGKKGQCN